MLRSRLHFPVLYQVLAGDAILICLGTLGGAYVAEVAGIKLAIIFAAVGTVLSLILNYLLLRRTARSIRVLEHTIEKIDRGDLHVRADLDRIDDSQLAFFAQALNKMLARLEAHTRITEQNRARMQRLSGQVLTAQEEERKRIARELHDDTSGSLARILLNLEMCDELLADDHAQAISKLRETRTLGEQTLENVRKLIFDLRPTLLDDLGLIPAVHWYAKTNLDAAGIALHFSAGESLRAAPLLETTMYRIAQEALTNVIRHARATQVDLTLAHSATQWSLTVQDNGCGFDPNTIAHSPVAEHGWGLQGIQERVTLLGGIFTIDSKPGQGATLRVEIPIKQA